MAKVIYRTSRVLPALLASTLSLPVLAQDANLVVKHLAVSAGADGVKHTVEYTERLVRRENQVWVERVVPAGWNSADEHKSADKSHKHHLDIATAARWVVRNSDGTIGVQLAAHEERALVTVTKVDYDNVGFDGSWDVAYHLVDPAALKRMKVVSTQGDLVTYASSEAGRSVKVVWNSKLKFPASVETRNGASSKRTTVEVLAQTKTLPWNGVKGYQVKEYADYLD